MGTLAIFMAAGAVWASPYSSDAFADIVRRTSQSDEATVLGLRDMSPELVEQLSVCNSANRQIEAGIQNIARRLDDETVLIEIHCSASVWRHAEYFVAPVAAPEQVARARCEIRGDEVDRSDCRGMAWSGDAHAFEILGIEVNADCIKVERSTTLDWNGRVFVAGAVRESRERLSDVECEAARVPPPA